MKIELEDVIKLKEAFSNQHMGEIVPVHGQDKDSFASFRGGLKDNWIFIGAVFALGMFVFNNLNDGKATDIAQDNKIEANAILIQENSKAIDQLTQNLQSTNTNYITGYNEIIRKIDSIQTAVDTLKASE